MTILLPPLGSPPERAAPVKVCLDVNVYVKDMLGAALGRNGSSSQIIEWIRKGQCALGELELGVSWHMLETLRIVLLRLLGTDVDPVVSAYISAIAGLSRVGRSGIEGPFLALGPAGPVSVFDEEDSTVLGAALAFKADLLVTENIRDFLPPRSRLPGDYITPLVAVIQRFSEPPLIVAAPREAIVWFTRGIALDPEALRAHYGVVASPIGQ